MAIKQEMVIEIKPDGSTNIETHGIKGALCEAEVKPLAEALGNVKDSKRTSEYYEREAVKTKTTTSGK